MSKLSYGYFILYLFSSVNSKINRLAGNSSGVAGWRSVAVSPQPPPHPPPRLKLLRAPRNIVGTSRNVATWYDVTGERTSLAAAGMSSSYEFVLIKKKRKNLRYLYNILIPWGWGQRAGEGYIACVGGDLNAEQRQ